MLGARVRGGPWIPGVWKPPVTCDAQATNSDDSYTLATPQRPKVTTVTHLRRSGVGSRTQGPKRSLSQEDFMLGARVRGGPWIPGFWKPPVWGPVPRAQNDHIHNDT